MVEIVNQVSSFPFHCDKCSKHFTKKESLKRHNKNVHNLDFLTQNHFFLSTLLKDEKEYSCPNCEKSFNQKGNLMQHLETYNTKKYSCDQCEQIYENRRSLQRHMSVHNNPELTYCVECSKTFASTERLMYHYNSFHKQKGNNVISFNGMYRTFSDISKEKQTTDARVIQL